MKSEQVRKYLLRANLAVKQDLLLPKALREIFFKSKQSLGDTLSSPLLAPPSKRYVLLEWPLRISSSKVMRCAGIPSTTSMPTTSQDNCLFIGQDNSIRAVMASEEMREEINTLIFYRYLGNQTKF